MTAYPAVGGLAATVLALLACHVAEPAGTEARGGQAARQPAAAVAGEPCAPGQAAPTGDLRRTVRVGGESREYLLHVPPASAPGVPRPLVLNLHGGGGTAAAQAALSRMDPVADEHGFLVAYPEGTRGLVGRGRYWNAGDCCGRAARQDRDDVAFLAAVVADVAGAYCVDPRRVYATGMSNGGMMAYRLACERADLVAAIASVAGSMVTRACRPGRPVAVLHIHGTADERVPYAGGRGLGVAFGAVEETIGFWAEQGRCAAATDSVRLDAVLCVRRGSCAPGGEVVLCTVEGGGHTWPGGRPRVLGGATERDWSGSQAIWDFFEAHPMPDP